MPIDTATRCFNVKAMAVNLILSQVNKLLSFPFSVSLLSELGNRNTRAPDTRHAIFRILLENEISPELFNAG